MARINILSTHTANQIAAGEVVERPASVIKELLENSIDAGATAVTIQTRGGGAEYIRITDNGCGIHHDDAEIAFLRHSTSKIKTSDDLESISTLGFRGEALASIAAVARVKVTTKTAEAESGTSITVEGGKVISILPAGCPNGTTVEVSDLFYNVPARQKFMKSPRAEAAYISDYVARMILIRPDISIRLIQSEKTVYQSAGDSSFDNAIFTVYGADILPYIKKVDYNDGYIRIFGYAGGEQISKLNRTQQSFYVNSRYIKSQKLSFALQRAYDTRLMSGRFPFAVLSVEIALDEIDVNVHPNKLDIRFKDENRVTHAVVTAVREALGDYRIPEYQAPARQAHDQAVPSSGVAAPDIPDISEARAVFERHAAIERTQVRESMSSYAPPRREYRQEPMIYTEPTEATDAPPAIVKANDSAEQTALSAIHYTIVGQLFECYWAVQQGDTVFFIDQHAAHERKLYEEFRRSARCSASQQLLVPAVIRLSPREHSLIMDNMELFNELGFEMEDFGANTVSVRAIPHILGQPQTTAFLTDAIGVLESTGRVSTADVKRRELIRSACKHAVKAGARLDEKEIEALLQAFRDNGVPLTCPHGRPVMTTMTRTEFEKLFKRIV